jgi:hypothetical protein
MRADESSRRFIATFRAGPGVDAIKALRAVLKTALRRHGLICTAVHEEKIQTNSRTSAISAPDAFDPATGTQRSP